METYTKTTEKAIPICLDDVAKNPKLHWACQTTNILDDQHISWSLVTDGKHPMAINAFNYGTGVTISKVSPRDGVLFFGNIFVEDIDGDYLFTDIVMHKGNIKNITHRAGNDIIWAQNGDLFLKINAFINMHFNKYTGYICFQSKGRSIISISLHVTPGIIALYPETWVTNLVGIYNGRGWK